MNLKRALKTFTNVFSKRAVQVAGRFHTNWLTGLWGAGTESKAGAEVNLMTAQYHTTVMSCWRVLSEGVAQLPLHLMERQIDKKGISTKQRAYNHKLYNVFNLQPNDETSSYSWIEAMMMNLVSRGNAFSQILRDKRGNIVGFVPLLTDSMEIYRTEDMKLLYVYHHERLGRVPLEKSECLHIVGLSFDGLHGLSPVAYSKNSIGLSIALEEHGSKLFANGANPSGVFETDAVLSDEAFERLKGSLYDTYKGLSNSGKPMLLEAGLKFKQISLSNDDAQFLESRRYQKGEIASIFRVPPHLINDLEHATFSNIEQQSMEFATFTLTPWIRRIEQAINIKLQEENPNLFVKFNMDSMVRGDLESRYNANGTAIRDGWKTRNEVRVQEGLNPIDGLDDPILPLNMGTPTGETDVQKKD